MKTTTLKYVFAAVESRRVQQFENFEYRVSSQCIETASSRFRFALPSAKRDCSTLAPEKL